MGLISEKIQPEIKQTLQFPNLSKDFFIVLRIALEKTPWEPDDTPVVKKTVDQLAQLFEFNKKVVGLRPKPSEEIPSQIPTPPEPDPDPVKIPEEKKVEDKPAETPVEKKNSKTAVKPKG